MHRLNALRKNLLAFYFMLILCVKNNVFYKNKNYKEYGLSV